MISNCGLVIDSMTGENVNRRLSLLPLCLPVGRRLGKAIAHISPLGHAGHQERLAASWYIPRVETVKLKQDQSDLPMPTAFSFRCRRPRHFAMVLKTVAARSGMQVGGHSKDRGGPSRFADHKRMIRRTLP